MKAMHQRPSNGTNNHLTNEATRQVTTNDRQDTGQADLTRVDRLTYLCPTEERWASRKVRTKLVSIRPRIELSSQRPSTNTKNGATKGFREPEWNGRELKRVSEFKSNQYYKNRTRESNTKPEIPLRTSNWTRNSTKLLNWHWFQSRFTLAMNKLTL